MARPTRLLGFHYGSGASYFVTFCTDRRRAVLAARRSGRLQLTPIGQLIATLWQGLPDRFPGVTLDEFVVHGVIHIAEGSRAELQQVVQGLKGLATIEARKAGVWGPQSLWQPCLQGTSRGALQAARPQGF